MLVFGLISCESLVPNDPTSSSVQFVQPLSSDTIVALINEERAQGHVCGGEGYFPPAPAVAWHSQLEEAAARHASDMAVHDFVGHSGSDGSNPAQRVSDTGYQWRSVAENAAGGYDSERAVIDAWLSSSGHCVNIMQAGYQHIGAAKAVRESSRYHTYWALVLASPQ